MCYFWK